MIPYLRDHPLLKLLWKLGKPDDSLEFKMGLIEEERSIDMFFMYPGPAENETWTGHQPMDDEHSKEFNVYPRFHRVCTADLHGYLVYVPCDPLPLLQYEYGYAEWMIPRGDQIHNRRENGTWLEGLWERGEVFRDYQS